MSGSSPSSSRGFSAIRMVTSRNVVHAALYLVVTLASVAAAYMLMGAEFVGWVQVLIYVGAIVVLVLFALMLTRAPIGRETLDNHCTVPLPSQAEHSSSPSP